VHSETTPWRLYQRTTLQVLHLQGIRREPPKAYLAANMSRYRMGTARSLADWERFAGVNLQSHKVSYHISCVQCCVGKSCSCG
jgi:hypothetical protein